MSKAERIVYSLAGAMFVLALCFVVALPLCWEGYLELWVPYSLLGSTNLAALAVVFSAFLESRRE